MRKSIEYPVLTRGIPSRTGRERYILVKDSAFFDIPEASASDAVVAATITDRHRGGAVAIVGYGGQLYSRIGTPFQGADEQAFGYVFTIGKDDGKGDGDYDMHPWSVRARRIAPVLRQIRNDHGNPLDTRLFPKEAADVVAGKVNVGFPGFRHDYSFKTLDEEPFEHARLEMEEAVLNLLLVDGELWARCHAPAVLHVPMVPENGDWTPESVIRLKEDVLHGSINRSLPEIVSGNWWDLGIVSPALDIEEGRERAQDLLRRYGGPAETPSPGGRERLEVLAPALFGQQDTVPLWLCHVAHVALRNLSNGLLQPRGPYDPDPVPRDLVRFNLARFGAEDMLLMKNLSSALEAARSGHGYGDLAAAVRRAAARPLAQLPGRAADACGEIMAMAADAFDDAPVSIPISGCGPMPGR